MSLRLSPTSPNHALQRTAPRVTLAAADHPAACAHPAHATFPQPARRAPQSLSLGSFGVMTRVLKIASFAAASLACTLRVDAADIPKTLQYQWSIQAAGNSGSVSISLNDGTVTHVLNGTRDSENKSEAATPTAAQWKQFKRTMNQIGVWSWKARYGEPDSGPFASYSWTLILKYPDRAVTAQGYTAQPKRFQDLQKALNALFPKPTAP